MKRIDFLLVALVLLSSCGSTKKTTDTLPFTPQDSYEPSKMPTDVVVDGKLKEWPEPLPGFIKETSLHYGISSNKSYLFIAVSTLEQQTQNKLLHAGMEVYITDKGRKETSTGIEFPLASIKESGFDGQSTNASANQPEMKVFGFKNLPDGNYPLSIEHNCKVVLSRDENNFLNIEYAIPLKEISNSIGTKNLQVGFKINSTNFDGAKRQPGEQNRSRDRSGMGGGIRGGGGGMHGGGGGMRGGGREQSSGGAGESSVKAQTFWTSYNAATAGTK